MERGRSEWECATSTLSLHAATPMVHSRDWRQKRHDNHEPGMQLVRTMNSVPKRLTWAAAGAAARATRRRTSAIFCISFVLNTLEVTVFGDRIHLSFGLARVTLRLIASKIWVSVVRTGDGRQYRSTAEGFNHGESSLVTTRACVGPKPMGKNARLSAWICLSPLEGGGTSLTLLLPYTHQPPAWRRFRASKDQGV